MLLHRLEQKNRNKRKLRFALLITLIGIVYAVFSLTKHTPHFAPEESTPKKVVEAITSQDSQPSHPDFQNSFGLESAVQNALEGTHGTYGIVVKNLSTQESYYFNEAHVFNTASLYKLWVMAAVFEQIQDKKFNMQDTLREDLGTLYKKFNVSPDPTEQQTSGTLSLSVQNALYQMITISDNNAALMLTDKISTKSLATFLQKNGFTESSLGTSGTPPTTTAYDVALFFEKLYNGKLANQEYTNDMITLLKQQRLNDKLPKYLPDDVDIAHKTGELDSFTHDGGIVYTSNGNYILVELSDSEDPDLAQERLSLVSQAVYNYFSQTPN